MMVEVVTDDKIASSILEILDTPYRIVELRHELRRRYGILISYARLRRILAQLVKEGHVSCFKYGKAVMYIKKELLT